MNNNKMDSNSFIYTTTNNKIQSGGYKINSLFLNNNIPAVVEFKKNGGNRAIPFGLCMIKDGYHNKIKPFKVEIKEGDVVDDNLFDKLNNMVKHMKAKKQKTTRRKNKGKGKRKSRRK